MDDFDRYLKEQMKDTDFKKDWDENESRYQRMLMVLHARNEEHLTQSKLAERTGLRQSNISRIKEGQAMPSIATFSKIAHGLGKRLEIRFISSYQQSTSIKTPVLSIKTKRGFYVKESLMP